MTERFNGNGWKASLTGAVFVVGVILGCLGTLTATALTYETKTDHQRSIDKLERTHDVDVQEIKQLIRDVDRKLDRLIEQGSS